MIHTALNIPEETYNKDTLEQSKKDLMGLVKKSITAIYDKICDNDHMSKLGTNATPLN